MHLSGNDNDSIKFNIHDLNILTHFYLYIILITSKIFKQANAHPAN